MVKERAARGYACTHSTDKRLESTFLKAWERINRKVGQAFVKTKNTCWKRNDTRDRHKDLEEERRETGGTIEAPKKKKSPQDQEEQTMPTSAEPSTTTYHLTSAGGGRKNKEERRREDTEESLSQTFLSAAAENKVEETEPAVKERVEHDVGRVRPQTEWTNNNRLWWDDDDDDNDNARELTPDPDTANGNVSLSENDGRKVTMTCVAETRPYAAHPERFGHWEQVLCRQALTDGRRYYWEVELSGWVSVAVAYGGIGRRGPHDDSLFGYNDRSWSLECDHRHHGPRRRGPYTYSAHHDGKATELDPVGAVGPSGRSNRVGVYVDWPAGSLSFYRVDTSSRTHLHTFRSCRFTEPLYPGFGFLSYGSSVSL